MQKHICSPCGGVFNSEEEYIAHKCKKTGFTPADAKHQGAEFVKVQEAALKRGAAKKVK